MCTERTIYRQVVTQIFEIFAYFPQIYLRYLHTTVKKFKNVIKKKKTRKRKSVKTVIL